MLVALDTNILAYALGINDAGRRARAEGLIAALPDANVVIPVQVLGELFRVLTGKSAGLASSRTRRFRSGKPFMLWHHRRRPHSPTRWISLSRTRSRSGTP